QVYSVGREPKIDTFSIPTTQLLINFVHFTSGAIGSHISYSPFYGRYFTFTRIYSPPTENSPGTMEVIVGMPTGFDPYSTVPSIVLKAITIAFGDDVQFSSNFDVVFPIAGMQRASATFL